VIHKHLKYRIRYYRYFGRRLIKRESKDKEKHISKFLEIIVPGKSILIWWLVF